MTEELCLISAIPALCNACRIITSGGTTSYSPDSAPMAIGKLLANLQGYDPSNEPLKEYNFTAASVLQKWSPTLYTMSGGAFTSVQEGGIVATSSAINDVCATNGYNTARDEYTLVSWYKASQERA